MPSWIELGDAIFELISPLTNEIEKGLVSLGKRLGYDLTPVVYELGQLEARVNDFIDTSTSLVSALESLSDNNAPLKVAYNDLVISTKDFLITFNNLKTLDANASSALRNHLSTITQDQSADVFASEFTKRLLDWLIVSYLERVYPTAYAACDFLGLVERKDKEGDTSHFRMPFTEYKLQLEGVASLLTDPMGWLATQYTQDGVVVFHPIFEKMEQLLLMKMLFANVEETLPNELADFAVLSSNPIRETPQPSYTMDISILDAASDGADLWGRLVSLPGFQDPHTLSFGAELVARGVNTQLRWEPTENLVMRLEASSQAEVSVRVLLTPDVEPIFGLTYVDGSRGIFRGAISWESEGPSLIIEGVGGIDIERLGLELSFGAEFEGEFLTGIKLSIVSAKVVIGGKNADGFLQRILPDEGLRATFSLEFGVDTDRGFYASGSGGLNAVIPLHSNLGPVSLNSVYFEIIVRPPDFELLLGISISIELGPVSASIERIGGQLLAPISGGDPQITFLPPTGAGLLVDAGGIIGGGFLKIDKDNKRYDGILTLHFGDIGLTAIGLITTQMPDGSDGFAMLISISVTYTPPIQLAFGFTLLAVGGIIALNTTMDIDVLRAGIKNRALDAILIPNPDTVIANAPQIISNMRAVFPPQEGRYVVGPMIKIGWGNPTVIIAEIGVFIELPDPVRIVLLGHVAAAFPNEKDAQVVINLNILGVLDSSKKELTFQASLHDSRILSYPLSGEAAFLLGWGNDPRFALSLGGFHPSYTPPAPSLVFAQLKRLTLSISRGGNLQLTCQAYQALTPNSLQFGARVSLFASAGGATITGYLGFDTIIIFSPFSFEVWLQAGVKVRYKGVSLLNVNLSMLLAGPSPWLARGKVKFKLIFTIKKSFCISWGNPDSNRLAAVDPWNDLQQAFKDPGNWSSKLPAGNTMVETLRPFEEENTAQLIVHPAGQLEIRQNIVPLGIGLDKVGNAPITGHDLFDIKKSIEIGGEIQDSEPLQEYFARGQFEELSSAQKLSLPSFEKMKAGVTIVASQTVRIDGMVEQKELGYESILIKSDRTSKPAENGQGQITWHDAHILTKANAIRKARQQAGPNKRFSPLRSRPKVGIPREESYCIARVEDLTRVDLSSSINNNNGLMTRMAADQALKAHLELHPEQANELIVVPEYEAIDEVMA